MVFIRLLITANLTHVSHFIWFIAKDASYQVLACYRQPAIGFFLSCVSQHCSVWFGHLYNLPSKHGIARHMETKLIFEGPSYTLPWWPCSNWCDVCWCHAQNFHWKREWVLSNMPFFLIPLSSFWNRFLHLPTIFFWGKKNTFYKYTHHIYIYIYTYIHIYIYSFFCFASWEPPWSTFTDRRSSTSGDQSILGSTVSAAHGGGCEVWWKNHEDGTTCGHWFRSGHGKGCGEENGTTNHETFWHLYFYLRQLVRCLCKAL